MKLFMNYIIKTSHSTGDEIVGARIFSAYAWKNANLSKNHWVNLRKENDCAWKCLGDGVCQLKKWKATVCSSEHSKDAGRLNPKKEIFLFFFSNKMKAGRSCSTSSANDFVVVVVHKTWWLLKGESLLHVAGQGVTITQDARFQFAFRFVEFDDKPLPLGFLLVSAAFPTARRCSLSCAAQTGDQLKPKSIYWALTPN